MSNGGTQTVESRVPARLDRLSSVGRMQAGRYGVVASDEEIAEEASRRLSHR